MFAFLAFIAGLAVGGLSVFGLYTWVLKPKTRQVIVIDPEQGRVEPRVIDRPE